MRKRCYVWCMEKIELKHLAPYLPYGLKLHYDDDKIGTLNRLSDINEYDDIKISIDYFDSEHIWMFKPILRPMSDFDKMGLLGDDYYSYMSKLNADLPDNIQVDRDLEFDIDRECYVGCIYAMQVYKFLFEHHFDVFNLIPAGLAIDINTLK